MSPRSSRRLALSLFVLTLVLIPPALVLGLLTIDAELPKVREDFILLIVLMDVLAAIYASVGAIVAARRPSNPIGWIFAGVGLSLAITAFAYGYGDYALYGEGTGLPAAELAAWVTSWSFILPVFIAPCFVLLLFPTGSLPTSRWRPVAAFGALLAGFATLNGFFVPGRLESFPSVENPIGVDGSLGDVVNLTNAVGEGLLAPVMFTLSISALAVRFRRSRGTERMQLKWLAYAATVMAVCFVLSFTIGELVARWLSDVLFLGGFLAFGLIPVAAGIAILRHRLYDIDVVINRTLVYGALTAALVATYVGGVLLLQLALSPFTPKSDLAIAGSTLAVAALFRPLRERIQTAVDRRFYRRRYDAARTVEAFSARLRDEVGLGAVEGELRAIAEVTVQPAHVSLWLRSGAP